MPNPPMYPIVLQQKDQTSLPATYFQSLLIQNAEHLRAIGVKRIEGIDLFMQTIQEFHQLEPHEGNKAWKLAKELNGWNDYFSELANLIQKHYLDADADKKQLHSQLSIDSGAKSSAHGDRVANANPQLLHARKKRNALKALYEELLAKTKFLEKASLLCKATYEANERNRGR